METKVQEQIPNSGQPALTFRYVYKNRFEEIAAAFVKKYNYEPSY
jgi:hypothetical protein